MNRQTTLGPPVWEEGMNPEQLEAIRHQEGPCRLLAAAGSGKTRALVHRVARMVAEGVDPRRILAVTFSKKAADEMNDRLDRLGVDGVRVGTWHSLCLQILRDDATHWANWEIDEGGAADVILKEVLGHKFLDWREADVGHVRSYIGLCKANLADPGTPEARQLAGFGHEGEMSAKAYALYQKLIEERGLLTFDDFLVFAARHLSDEANRKRWAGKWRYLLQDEVQDANRAQIVIASLLAKDHRNYFVVGDVSQSIYSWRGSKPEYLASFADDWQAKSIDMCRNYRSGSKIVEAANTIIRPAKVRGADMVAERGQEGEVEVVRCPDHDEEGEELAALVEERLQQGGRYSDVTALFRTNAQSRALEEALLKKRIPYVVVGGTSFYDRKEVRDLLAYLRVAAGRDHDGKAVRRCINSPFRYLGKAFVEKVEDAADELAGSSGHLVDWLACVQRAAESAGVQARQRESAAQWAAIIQAAQKAILEPPEAAPAALLLEVVHKTQYLAWISRDQGEESIESSHVANVRELLRIAERFETVGALVDYIDEAAKAAAKQRKDRSSGGDRVLLMSVHRSKGLEWPVVFVAGCNEGLLPHAHAEDIEEERRLLYVAATRARDHLVLSHVGSFARGDGVKDAMPSRFLVEAGLVQNSEVLS